MKNCKSLDEIKLWKLLIQSQLSEMFKMNLWYSYFTPLLCSFGRYLCTKMDYFWEIFQTTFDNLVVLPFSIRKQEPRYGLVLHLPVFFQDTYYTSIYHQLLNQYLSSTFTPLFIINYYTSIYHKLLHIYLSSTLYSGKNKINEKSRRSWSEVL